MAVLKKPIEQKKPIVENSSPFVSIKKPPALPSKAPVSEPPPQKQTIQPASKKPVKAPETVETDADCLSDASKSDLSLSELGDTTEQESDWPELDNKMTVTSIKPRAVTPNTITSKPLEPKQLTPRAVKPISPAMSKSSSRVPSIRPESSVKQSDAEIVTDYDDLSDTDLTLGDTTDAETTTTNNNTTMRPVEIGRQESMRSEMTESDWDFEAPTIKPTTVASIKPQQLKPTTPTAGAFTKQPLPILKAKTPSPVKPAAPISPNKTSFDAMKPKAMAKKADDIFSDAKMDDSDGDTSVLSDGQTTDNSEGFNV